MHWKNMSRFEIFNLYSVQLAKICPDTILEMTKKPDEPGNEMNL